MEERAHILVVDDDADFRDALVDTLEADGFATAPAADGRQALDYLRSGSRKPDLILLDVMMPNMNGFEFRAAQLDIPAYAGIPVVVLTANQSGPAAALKASCVLRKPIQAEKLIAAIDGALGSSAVTS